MNTTQQKQALKEILNLSKVFRLKNVVMEKNPNLDMLKNVNGQGNGISFTQAKRINAALLNFTTPNGDIDINQITQNTITQLYDSLYPIRELIENNPNKTRPVRLQATKMFEILSEDKHIKTAYEKQNPDAPALTPIEAGKIKKRARENRTLTWDNVKKLDTLSTHLYKAVTQTTPTKGQRLIDNTQNLPQVRKGPGQEDEKDYNLGALG